MAPRPRPRPPSFFAVTFSPVELLVLLFHALDEFFRTGHVGLGTLARAVVDDAGQAVARRLGKPHVARNDGLEDLVAEMLLKLRAHLLLERDARVEHHAQKRHDAQVLVLLGTNALDAAHEVGKPLERIVFALHRNDDAVSRAQRVERQHRQARRTVDEHIVVLVELGLERLLEAHVSMIKPHELHLGTRQLAIAGRTSKPPSAEWQTACSKLAMPSSTS